MFVVPVLWWLRQENAWDSLTIQTAWNDESCVPTEKTLKTNQVDGYWGMTPDVCLCPIPGAFKYTRTFKCVSHMPLNMHRHLHMSPVYIWTQTHKHLYSLIYLNVYTYSHVSCICTWTQTHLSVFPCAPEYTYLHVSLTCTWTYAHIYMSHMCTWTYKHI